MKRIIILSFGILILLALAYSCRKDNINGDAKALVLGSYIKLDSVITQNLDFSIPTATVGIMVIGSGSPVASIDIYLAKGEDAEDSSEWVFIKNVPYTDKVLLTVSTAELTEALAPDVITPGTEYQLRNVVNTKDGRKFASYNTPENYSSFPGYKMAIKWKATAVCPYTGNASMAGEYTVVSDPNWQDWAAGDGPVVVKAGSKENQLDLSNFWPNPLYGTSSGPWYVDIDPVTGEGTVAKNQKIGHYTSSGGYDLSVDASNGTGFVFSCTGIITLTVPLYASGFGPQGSAKLVLKKNP